MYTNSFDRRFVIGKTACDKYLMIPPTYSDVIGKGWSLYQDYTHGTDPTKVDTDGDGIPDASDPYPLDYYNGFAPMLTKASGDNQWVYYNYSLPTPQPLVVQVTNGSSALVNAPVVFSSTTGMIEASYGGTPSTSLTVRTDSSGNAKVWYTHGATYTDGTVSAQASYTGGSVTVTFTAHVDDPNISTSNLVFRVNPLEGVTANATNNAVSAWASEYGSYVTTQTNNAAMPVLSTTNTIGNQPGLYFNGTNSSLIGPTSSGLDGPYNYTYTTVINALGNNGLWSKYSTAGGAARGIDIYMTSGGVGVNDSEGGYQQAYASGVTLGSPEIVTVMHNGEADTIYFNGALITTGGGFFSANGDTTTPLYLGSGTHGSWKGYMGDTFFYQRALNAAEILTQTEFLARKYGITLPLAPITLNHKGGVYQNTVSVTASSTAGANIYYTTDGSTPTTSSTLYTGAITVTTSTQLNFVAVKAGYYAQTPVGYYYTIQSGYAPTAVGGLMAWWTAGVGFNEAGGTWTDQSGNNMVLSKGTNACPTYVASATYGQPAIRTDGATQSMSMTGLALGQADEVIAVVRPASANTSYYLNHGGLQFFSGGTAMDSISAAGNGVSSIGYTAGTDPHIVDLPLAGASLANVYVNGSTAGNIPWGTGWGGTGLDLGLWAGDYEEILIFNANISAGNRANIVNWLMAKYGMNVLPDGLPAWKQAGISTGDSNGDGISDLNSYLLGLSPTASETDGQAAYNAQQLAVGNNPLTSTAYAFPYVYAASQYYFNPWLPPTPNPSDHTPPVLTLDEPVGATLLP